MINCSTTITRRKMMNFSKSFIHYSKVFQSGPTNEASVLIEIKYDVAERLPYVRRHHNPNEPKGRQRRLWKGLSGVTQPGQSILPIDLWTASDHLLGIDGLLLTTTTKQNYTSDQWFSHSNVPRTSRQNVRAVHTTISSLPCQYLALTWFFVGPRGGCRKK